MNITPGGNPVSFTSIDTPLEAFVTPPNDPLVGILMGQLPRDRVEIRGSLGGKEFSYLYTLDKEKIAMRGAFDGLTFKYDGTFARHVSMSGTMGENQLSSSITPEVQGPRTTSHAGEVELWEKLDFNPFSGAVHVTGDLGGAALDETIKVSDDGTCILDSGTIRGLGIERKATRVEGGFCIEGTLGGLEFREYIVTPKKH